MGDFEVGTYQSPFTWRYGSNEMRRIFSEESKYRLWRKIWLSLARGQYSAGLVSKMELSDLELYQDKIDIKRILELEKETKHDVVAAIKEFAEKAKVGGGKIHLGATSMDVVDNADILRIKKAIKIIEKRLYTLLLIFADKIERYVEFPCIGYTHLQPAEPTTIGYRLAFYAQDLLQDAQIIQIIKRKFVKSKGFKGAVGTAASYQQLLRGTKQTIAGLERNILKELKLETFLITSQVYPRKLDFIILFALANISQSLHKFAFDLRVMQSPQIGEWSEPFAKKQIGSSAMPFKRNPIKSENICSLARYLVQLARVGWDNAANSLLERTLDDSANRRIIIPEAFLAIDQMLITAQKVLSGLIINEKRVRFNLKQYGPFAATEIVLMETVKKGANRQEMHEVLRGISLKAWKYVQEGKQNPLKKMLIENSEVKEYLSANRIKKLLDVSSHIGDAPERAKQLISALKKDAKAYF